MSSNLLPSFNVMTSILSVSLHRELPLPFYSWQVVLPGMAYFFIPLCWALRLWLLSAITNNAVKTSSPLHLSLDVCINVSLRFLSLFFKLTAFSSFVLESQ
jgi:hypothetical protein